MKRLMSLMLGLSLAFACVTVSSAQDTKKSTKTKKPPKSKKSKKTTGGL
jgi:hypothetical protein